MLRNSLSASLPICAAMAGMLLLSGCGDAPVTTAHAQSMALAEPGKSGAGERYLPEYTASGELVLPKNFERWIYLGSPLTPNALNKEKPGFPEYHNVYMEPASYDIYQKTGNFPEGTILLKELQLTKPRENADGSRTEPSGRGYFPDKLNGADVTVKDSKRFAETGGWGYFNFNHSEPKAPTAKLRSNAECHSCHESGAKKDFVWTQFYPRLDH